MMQVKTLSAKPADACNKVATRRILTSLPKMRQSEHEKRSFLVIDLGWIVGPSSRFRAAAKLRRSHSRPVHPA
jgi:hypothetical protein